MEMSAAASFSSPLSWKSSPSSPMACRRSNWISSSFRMACRPSTKPHGVRTSLKKAAACVPSTSQFPASPWLILPTGYAAYSPAEDRVFDLNEGKDWPEDEEALLVGSSHGWVVLEGTKTHKLSLWDPISGRHKKLPCSPTRECRVILSCSPDDPEKECYAMVYSQTWADPPAFYLVGGGDDDWTDLLPASPKEEMFWWSYGDFSYCSARKVWSFITKSGFVFDSDGIRIALPPSNKDVYNQIDHWGVNPVNLTSSVDFSKFGGPRHSWKENEDGEFLSKRCIQELHLVYSYSHSHSHRLPLVVVRFIEMTQRGYGSSVVGFIVLEIDEKAEGAGRCIKVVEDLKGLAIFVGINEAFAVPAVAGLMPNSIYYAPPTRCLSPFFGCNDVGIFDYQNKAFHPSCYYPNYSDIGDSPTDQHPMWFIPNL